jgi:intein/homing endonuclease
MAWTAETSRKGGLATSRRHPEIFEKGREIAIAKARRNARHVDQNIPLTEDLAELLGAYIGDGFTNTYLRYGITQFAGHKILDDAYLRDRLAPILRSIAPTAKHGMRTAGNGIHLTIYSKELHRLWTQRFKMPAGKKSYTVVIPDEVLRADKHIVNACVRGIFDTDGCVAFDKRSKYRKPYIRIILSMRSQQLLQQISTILTEQDINVKLTQYRLQINGEVHCARFVKNIGFSNERHKKKLTGISDVDDANL